MEQAAASQSDAPAGTAQFEASFLGVKVANLALLMLFV